MQGMGRVAHTGNANSPTFARYADGLTPALYATGGPTEVWKHLEETAQ